MLFIADKISKKEVQKFSKSGHYLLIKPK